MSRRVGQEEHRLHVDLSFEGREAHARHVVEDRKKDSSLGNQAHGVVALDRWKSGRLASKPFAGSDDADIRAGRRLLPHDRHGRSNNWSVRTQIRCFTARKYRSWAAATSYIPVTKVPPLNAPSRSTNSAGTTRTSCFRRNSRFASRNRKNGKPADTSRARLVGSYWLCGFFVSRPVEASRFRWRVVSESVIFRRRAIWAWRSGFSSIASRMPSRSSEASSKRKRARPVDSMRLRNVRVDTKVFGLGRPQIHERPMLPTAGIE